MLISFSTGHGSRCKRATNANTPTIYSPPNHPDGTVHKTKADAQAAEEAESHA